MGAFIKLLLVLNRSSPPSLTLSTTSLPSCLRRYRAFRYLQLCTGHVVKLEVKNPVFFFHYNTSTAVSSLWRAFWERPRELNFRKFSLFVSVYYDFISTENNVCEMERQRYGAGAQHHFSAIMHPRRLSGLRYELAGGKESLGVRCERSHEADRLLLDLRIFCWGSRKHSSPFLTVDFRHQSVRNWVWITTLTGLLVPTWGGDSQSQHVQDSTSPSP